MRRADRLKSPTIVLYDTIVRAKPPITALVFAQTEHAVLRQITAQFYRGKTGILNAHNACQGRRPQPSLLIFEHFFHVLRRQFVVEETHLLPLHPVPQATSRRTAIKRALRKPHLARANDNRADIIILRVLYLPGTQMFNLAVSQAQQAQLRQKRARAISQIKMPFFVLSHSTDDGPSGQKI